MDVYKTRARVISHERTQKCIKLYNALISVFIHYEMIYHKAWYDSADIVSFSKSLKSVNFLTTKKHTFCDAGQTGAILATAHPPSKNQQILSEF